MQFYATTGSGGYCIDVTGDGTFRSNHMVFENIIVSGTGSWQRCVNVDGSQHTTGGSQGIRNITFTNCEFFGADEAGEGLVFKNVVQLMMIGCYIQQGAGSATPSIHVTGTGGGGSSTSSSQNVVITGVELGGDLILDNCNKVFISGNISGDVTIASTATNVTIMGFVGGTITNSSASATIISPQAALSSLQPAFAVINSGADSSQTGNGAVATVEFNTEDYDQGSDFNNTTDTFTAPIGGRYLLSAQVKIDSLTSAADDYELSIITSNLTYLSKNIKANSLNTTITVAISIVADMDVNDTATVGIEVNGEANDTVVRILGGGNPASTFFSGILLT